MLNCLLYSQLLLFLVEKEKCQTNTFAGHLQYPHGPPTQVGKHWSRRVAFGYVTSRVADADEAIPVSTLLSALVHCPFKSASRLPEPPRFGCDFICYHGDPATPPGCLY